MTYQVDDVLPAVLFWSHGYHQPLPRPDAAVAQVSGQWRPLGGHCFSRTTLNLSLTGHRSSVRLHMCAVEDLAARFSALSIAPEAPPTANQR